MSLSNHETNHKANLEKEHDMARQTVLVLGATGGIGGEVARQLLEAGWHVRGLRRAGNTHAAKSAAPAKDGIEWIQGDALNRDDVMRAARGAACAVRPSNR